MRSIIRVMYKFDCIFIGHFIIDTVEKIIEVNFFNDRENANLAFWLHVHFYIFAHNLIYSLSNYYTYSQIYDIYLFMFIFNNFFCNFINF